MKPKAWNVHIINRRGGIKGGKLHTQLLGLVGLYPCRAAS
jgi:hypothetical protein